MNKIIIVPDVHGRSFWKKIKHVKDTPIVFLGDYLDPYGREGISNEDAIQNFKEILHFEPEIFFQKFIQFSIWYFKKKLYICIRNQDRF